MKLRIATWNIHRCVGGDGRRDPDRVAAVLREIDADVVGLQEVDNVHGDRPFAHQAEHLAADLDMACIAGPTVLRSDGDYGNALLTRLPIRSVSRHDLSVPQREPRGALDVRLGPDSRALRVVVTHLGLRAWERARQARKLLDTALPAADAGGPLVLMGDFNLWFGPSRAGWLLGRRLGRSPRVPTWPAGRPLFAIDRIWARPGTALRGLHAHRSRVARDASDHLPLVGELTL